VAAGARELAPSGKCQSNRQGKKIMRRHGILTSTTMSLLFLGLALPGGDAAAQQKSLKEQLVGTWVYVSVYDQYEDGKKTHSFGTGVKGSLTFDGNGRFSQIIVGEARPELKTNDPRRPDALVVAFYGTYAVNEAEKTYSTRIEAAAYSARVGTEFKVAVTINGDTLRYVGSPRKDQVGTFSPHAELKRAK
jgi:hypothetical protein